MGRWGMQGRSKAVRWLEDYPEGGGCIPVRERERERGLVIDKLSPENLLRYFTLPTRSSFQLFEIRKPISFRGKELDEGIEMD